ncbi:hypothetical protein GCM10011519_15810 [Marmoricola endophyticus]|uniref:Uncharacterized protein n=1 Tax=Marmoricola endophyticus TaxID=2040280 RepID=A0A917F1D6_9ACTN|nr:HAD domain-containing protein [Marmoricola endophyticus]GGF42767.1 hypothetical protein GCM10011519_15810 [Marmoricola endophyticus]
MPVNLYLDVDGVLNAVSLDTPDWGWPDAQLSTVNGYPIRWSTTMVARLNRLVAREEVTAYWLTTWGSDAAELLAPALGLDATGWSVLGEEDRERAIDTLALSGTAGWWKLQAVRSHLAPGTPAIWVDDDLDRDPSAVRWAYEQPGLLPLSPSTSLALTPADLAAMEAHVDRVGGVGASSP